MLVTNKRFILKKREMRYISCLIQYRGVNWGKPYLRPNIAGAMTPRSSADLPLSSPSSLGRQARQPVRELVGIVLLFCQTIIPPLPLTLPTIYR